MSALDVIYRILRAAALAVAGCCLTGCHMADLTDPETDAAVEVRFDWRLAPEAPAEVAGMTVWFFPLDAGGKIWRFDIAGSEGGHVELPAGRYSVVAANNDVAGVEYSSPASPSGWTATLDKTPGGVWSATCQETSIGICSGGGAGIVMTPEPVTARFRVIAEGIKGIAEGAALRGSLTGLASKAWLSPVKYGNTPFTATFLMEDDGPGSAAGSFRCFPWIPGEEAELTLEADAGRGKRIRASIDVTQQLREAPDPMDVTIRVGPLDLSDPSIGEGGGIDAVVDGWTVVTVELGSRG